MDHRRRERRAHSAVPMEAQAHGRAGRYRRSLATTKDQEKEDQAMTPDRLREILSVVGA